MTEYTGPDGKQYDLRHLKPTNYQVSITVDGKRYLVPLVVTFSHHCYSDGDGGAVQPGDPWYLCQDHKGHRVFCPTRWESSLDLPENIGFLINQNKGCYDAKSKGNYLHLRNPNVKFPGNGWYVMFNFKRATLPALVHMSINSHHHRRALPTDIRNARQKPFGMMLAQWLSSKSDLLELLDKGKVPGAIPVEAKTSGLTSSEEGPVDVRFDAGEVANSPEEKKLA